MSGKRRSLAELASASSVATPTQSATVVATPMAAEASPPVEETARRPAAAPVATPAAAGPRPPTRGRATSTRGHAGGRRSPSATATRPARFDELERKEARLRADQYEALTTLSRQLNRVRGGQGQRITENTLIRVAIDLLLASDNLTGVTEDALRKSVTS